MDYKAQKEYARKKIKAIKLSKKSIPPNISNEDREYLDKLSEIELRTMNNFEKKLNNFEKLKNWIQKHQ